MSLRIAFTGYNENQTRTYFREMAELNREQIGICDFSQGRIVLKDGTEIIRICPGVQLIYLPFAQVIIADDSRRNATVKIRNVLYILAQRLMHSRVPPEYQWQYYDLDTEVYQCRN